MTPSKQHGVDLAQVGDWIEVDGLPGRPPRRGQVTEVLGAAGHEHYRVRWDERHESLFFPTEGVHVHHEPGRRRGGRKP